MDNDPDVSQGPVRNRLLNIRQVKALVIRDLENLLNARRQISMVPAAYKEVHKSVFMYGLADYTSENPKSPSVRQRLRQDIEKTLARFEPRLRNVAVHLEDDKEKGRNLRFRITGLLVVEPETEPVSFDTVFDTSRGEYVIQK